MKRILKILLIVAAASAVLTSCDLFMLGPSLRVNYDDPDIGFGRFESELIGDGEVRVGWDWFDLERKLRGLDPVYDQIVIKHSTGSYPTTRLGGEKFDISDWNPVSDPMWSAVFKDLKWDREHYFALYAHERNGRWMAPIYTSLYFDGYDQNTFFFPMMYSVSANFSGGTHAQGALNANQADICYFDIWENGAFRSARLNMEITAAPAVDGYILIYPMRVYWDTSDFTTLNIGDPVLYPDQLFIDRSIAAVIPVSTTATTFSTFQWDITDVLSKARMHGTNGLMFMTGGQDISINVFDVQTELVRRW